MKIHNLVKIQNKNYNNLLNKVKNPLKKNNLIYSNFLEKLLL